MNPKKEIVNENVTTTSYTLNRTATELQAEVYYTIPAKHKDWSFLNLEKPT